MEDRRHGLSIFYPLFFILALLLAGCQSSPPPKPETAPLNYSAYLYSLYDTESTSRPAESLKEDRLTLKPHAVVAVARLGEFAPREALLQQLRANTNLFSRVSGIPAVLEVPSQSQGNAPQETVKDHIARMRQLAADMGADYLYLIGGTMQSNMRQDASGVLDLTIIGYFLVPSNRVEVDTRGSSALVDVVSGRVVSVVTEQEKRIYHIPSAQLETVTKDIHRAPLATIEMANAQMEEGLTKKLVEQLESRK